MLVTLDTTRSDRLGCYGYQRGTTPHIDKLAERSILFERAVAPAPVTLPAHTTVMTGLDPHEHGVRNNGTFVLAETFLTLAEVLNERGYATGATLAGAPLHRRSGLSQGFDQYDDAFGVIGAEAGLPAIDPLAAERTADDVAERVISWIAGRRAGLFFHWAHFFDPHYPWEAPAPFRDAFEDPYDGEVAFMDAELGRIIRELERLDLARNTWILLVGDHGESLREHNELMHGMLVYGATQSVPCILTPPRDWSAAGTELRGRRVGEIVRLKDLFATLCNALNIVPREPAAVGPSLLALAAGEWDGPRAAYVEAMAPYLDFGWSALRGVRTAEWSYIRGVEPELYDLTADPGETRNVAGELPDVAGRLEALCESLAANAVPLDMQAVDPGAAARLRSLGYAAAPARELEPEGASGRDPRELVQLLEKITMASDAYNRSETEQAVTALNEVLRADPGNPLATSRLADIYLATGAFARLRELCQNYAAQHPADSEGRIRLADAHLRLAEYGPALAVLEDMAGGEAPHPGAADLYPQVLAAAGRADEAREFINASLARSPSDPDALMRMAFLEVTLKDRRAALRLAKLALSYAPDHAEANALAGELLLEEAKAFAAAGDDEALEELVEEAKTRLARALEQEPAHAGAAFQIARILQNERELSEARRLYEVALRGRPDWAEARVRLGDVLLELGDATGALRSYEIADALGFVHAAFFLKYGAALARTGRFAEAQAVWERGLALDPAEPIRNQLRDNIEKAGALK